MATGDTQDIFKLLKKFHAAGAHKFILRPMAFGTEDMLEQTRLMVNELLPAVSALN